MAINYGSLQATLNPRGVVSGKVQNATRAFVKDYDLLENKPKVNGVELSGDKSLDDLGIEIPEIVANPGDATENLTSIGIDGVNYNIQGSGGSAVNSVNGKTGDVNLDAEDVGALPDDTPIPSELADLSEDSTHRTVTDTEKTAWNAKADISDLPTVNNSTITIQKNNQNVDSFTLNQDSNKSINISVPTKTSDLQNDNSFITNTVNNLANYYLKTQTYTQVEVDALIQATVNGRFQKVNTLPASGEPNVIYLVPKTTPETSNACDEYIWQDNAWELIGSTEIDLSGYVTTTDLAIALQSYLTISAFNTAIANYYTKTETGNLLDNKVDKVSGKGLSTNDYDDTAKGIVDGVTSALAGKVDKENGKGLSTNDYDNTAKGIVDGVTSALAGKVDKVDGKSLSTNDYTTTEKNKLAGIASGAEVNQNAFSNVKVGSTTIASGGKTATLELEAGSNVTLTPDAANKKVVLSATDTTYSEATTSAAGLMSASDKTKLNGISTGATKTASSTTNGHIEIDDVDTVVYDDTDIQNAIEDIDDIITTDESTIEGNPINFSTLSAQNAKSTILSVEPIQDLHGYDKPWVGGAGKNLCPLVLDQIKTINTQGVWNGNKYTVNNVEFNIGVDADDNIISITVNRISNSSVNSDLYIGNVYGSTSAFADSGTYTFSVNTSNTALFIGYGNTTFNTRTSRTETVSDGIAWMILRVNAETNVTNEKVYPMLCLSTALNPTVFEPYENLCPISGRTEIGILGCGKNIIDSLEQGIYATDASTTASTTRVKSKIFKLTSGTYSISYSTSLSKTVNLIYAIWKNGTYGTNEQIEQSTWLSTNPYSLILTQDSYVSFTFRFSDNSTITASDVSVQVEKGSPTTYEPYNLNTDLTIEFGSTVYGGTLDVEKGQLVADKGYKTFDGTENWEFNALGNASVQISDMRQGNNQNGLCSYLEIGATSGKLQLGAGGSNRIYIIDATNKYGLSTTAQVQAFTNGMDLIYPLSTPITIQLTPHQISLLKGVNNISVSDDYSTITLTYRSGEVATLGDLKDAVDDMSAKMHVYSTTEQVVGTSDDGRPLYEKTLNLNATQIADNNYSDSDIEYADQFNIVSGYYVISGAYGNISLGLNSYESSSLYTRTGFRMYNKTLFTVTNGYTAVSAKIIIQYTKTTDT